MRTQWTLYALLAINGPAWRIQADAREEGKGHKHTQVHDHQRYALSEVVIQPNADIVHLGHFVKRQDQPQSLKNNIPSNRTINPGENQVWVFPTSELASSLPAQTPYVPEFPTTPPNRSQEAKFGQELKRQTGPTQLYIDLDVCNQPAADSGTAPTGPPPGLALYVSRSADNKNPGPQYQGSQQTPAINTDGGHASYSDHETGDTYIAVHAPTLTGFTGGWTYRISVSTETSYSDYIPYSMLRVVDSDPTSSLLVTERFGWPGNTTQDFQSQWLSTGGPFSLFVYNATDPTLGGVNKSYCGLTTYALSWNNVPGRFTNGTETGMRLTNETWPYQRFYMTQLQKSSNYKAALGLTSRYSRDLNSNTPGGGGTVFQSLDFQTRSTENCHLIYNLTFCDQVAYSVPTNGSFNRTALSALYDNYTSSQLWPQFSNSLDQIPCNTSDDARYSLARTCDDCQDAYKDWVCAVSIPRCADILSPAPFLKVRNTQPSSSPNQWPNGSTPAINSSLMNDWNAVARNEQLGSYMNSTGPYAEVLPCDDLCYNLVQSCPSALGFACPLGDQLRWGYYSPGRQRINSSDGYPECNYPGRLWAVNAAPHTRAHVFIASIIVLAVTLAFT